MQPFDRYFLDIYCVPGTVPGIRDAAGNKADNNPSLGTGNTTESPGSCVCEKEVTEHVMFILSSEG